MNQDIAHTEKRDGRRENAAATQKALRDAGQRLFASIGYEATTVGALCADAGVTTGALYHHYGDKKRLFAAVAEELDRKLVELAMRTHLEVLSSGGNGWDAFLAGVDAILSAGVDPGLRRIGLVDAPAVLGAAGWQAIREQHGHGAMTRTIESLQAQGLFDPGDSKRLAWLVLGLIYSAVQSLPDDATSAKTALADNRRLVRAMLSGLRRGT
jgi:AcrR family transcriptional regulator